MPAHSPSRTPHSSRVPDVVEVDRIAALGDPVLRNLQITQCYHELSAALAGRTGAIANWCTFATWASKQAGQTIRREDFARTLDATLNTELMADQALLIATFAKRLGSKQTDESLQASIWNTLICAPIDRASAAVSRGNKKVFEEIGRECARFVATCLRDPVFDAESIQRFCNELRPGLPPMGQQYLRQAFTHYYQSFFEADRKHRAELQLLANIEIGFHEQTRLQPDIADALNAAVVEPREFRSRLIEELFPTRGWLTRIQLLGLWLLGKRARFDRAIEDWLDVARHRLRLAITAHLMTITFPRDVRLRLGQDLSAGYPEHLMELRNPDLCTLLGQIDPTPNSVRESGAVDWADLRERIHFIVDLFRCYQVSEGLLEAPFNPEQIVALKAGGVPSGRL